VRTEKGRSGSSSVAFCYYLKLGEKDGAFEDRKWHKDNKYWSLPGTDKNTSVASPLQASLPAIVITWDEVPGKSIFKDLSCQLLSRRYGYKKVKDRLYFDMDLIDLANKQSFEIQELLGHKDYNMTEIYTHVSIKSLGKIVSPIDTLNPNKGG
jgi:hypothetical protein